MRAAVQRHEPGDTFPVVVRRDGKEQTVTAKTGGVRRPHGHRASACGSTTTCRSTSRCAPATSAGPSAGLMFSLAIYDALTPGELTGGKNIAGTGTMDDDGTVGPIGGIRQKLIGARRAGADYFLAPADNCDEVVGNVPDGLQVVKVGDLRRGRRRGARHRRPARRHPCRPAADPPRAGGSVRR